MTGAAYSSAIERRGFCEVRTISDGRRLEGYAAKFGTRAALGRVEETILPGAFRASLSGDILALADHDPTRVLARTRSGTLRLFEDATGLGFSLDLPDTQAARDLQALAQRGDLGGMSFGFLVPKGGETWRGNVRELRTIDLKEISVVSAFPAYPDTSVALRSMEAAQAAESRRRRLILAEHGL